MKNLIAGIILLCLPFCGGCIAFYTYEKYHAKVIDAEANVPVNDVTINIRYLTMVPYLNPARPVEVTTRQDGSAAFSVADYASAKWRIKAEGYLPIYEYGYRVPDIFNIETGNNVIIPIYQKPEPKIEIIVPDGYRGPVALHLIPANKWIQETPGKRAFSFTMMPNGYVPVQASLLFHDIDIFSITARYENGKKISCPRYKPDGPNDICLLWVYSMGEKILYSIGTEKERDNLWNTVWVEILDYGDIARTLDPDIFNSYFQD